MLLWSFEIRIKFFRSSFYHLFFVNILNKISYASKNVNYILSSFSPTKKTALLSLPSTWSSVFSIHIVYFITIFISTRKCWFYAVFRYLSSDLLHFYSNFKPIFSVQLLLLFSFLLKRACINRLSLPMWSDLRVSALPVGLLHFHNTL